jgi:hypothetical protein
MEHLPKAEKTLSLQQSTLLDIFKKLLFFSSPTANFSSLFMLLAELCRPTRSGISHLP